MTNYRDSKSKIVVNAKSCSPSLGVASHAPPADEQANFVFKTRYRGQCLVGAVHAPPADFDYKLLVQI
jgi:hypothetical protein